MAEEVEEKTELYMSAEEAAATASYEVDIIKGIDTALLAEIEKGYWLKTARIIARAMKSCPSVPQSYFLERLISLAESGQLEHQGNLRLIRFSEIRKPIQAQVK